jgi:hypothetical protein
MDDPVHGVVEPVIGETEISGILRKGVHLKAGDLVTDRLILPHGGDIMIGRERGTPGAVYLQTTCPQTCKCLRTGHLVTEMSVYI